MFHYNQLYSSKNIIDNFALYSVFLSVFVVHVITGFPVGRGLEIYGFNDKFNAYFVYEYVCSCNSIVMFSLILLQGHTVQN